MQQVEPSAPSSARPPRWWPAQFILILAAIGLVAVRFSAEQDEQRRFLLSVAVVLLAASLLLVWLILLSRLPWRRRMLFLALLVGCCVGFAALVDLRGFDGDMKPIFGWRFAPERAPAAPGAASGSESGSAAAAGEWAHVEFPGFLGARRDGRIENLRLAPDWEANPPELLWRRPVGAAWSGFAISSGLAVTLEQLEDRETIRAYDLTNGDSVWSYGYAAMHDDPLGGPGPRSTPTIDDGAVFTLGGTGVLSALSLESGELLWARSLQDDLDAYLPTYGIAASPLVRDGQVIVAAGGPGASLAAYSTIDGHRIWAGGFDRVAYSSPTFARFHGRDMILLLNESAIVAHSPEDGAVIWSTPWPAGTENVSQPVILPNDRFFVSTGYGVGGRLYRVEQAGEDVPGGHAPGGLAVEVVWESKSLKAKFTNVVHRDGFLYGLDDGILVCVSVENGTRRWKRGRYGHGQILLVDDLLLISAEDGDIALVKANPDAFEELGRMPAIEGKTWNHPALAGPVFLVRSDIEAAAFRLALDSTPTEP